jgi:glycosyltransferase involved in cell wall biosynthesis
VEFLKVTLKVQSEIVKLSVIVASLYSPTALKNCLESVLANEQNASEIIVADCCLKSEFTEWTKKYPAVNFIEFSPQTSLPVMLGAAIARAKGELIAITDSSGVVADDWISSISRAHQAEKSSVIGGAVEIRGQQMKSVDWAAYFCEYAQFMRPLRRGAVDVLAGNNISFKRPILQKGKEYVEPEFWKTYWCEELKAEGIKLFSEPAMLIYYAKTFRTVPFLVRRFHHGRCFAGMRTKQAAFSKCAFYLVGSLVLPFIFLYRTIATVLGKKRFFKELLLSFPMILLAIVFWSLGETCGYLAGTGRSCENVY